MENTKIFVDGLTWKDPRENAPKFVKGSIFLNASRLRKFLEDNVQHISEKGWFTIDMKESQNGVIYFELNTWKPNKNTGTTPVEIDKSTMTSTGMNGEKIDTNSIPF